GLDLIACPWHAGTLNVLRGLEKNLFAGCDYSLSKVLASTAGTLFLGVVPAAMAVCGAALALGGAPLLAASAWAPYLLQTRLLMLGYRTEAPRYGTSALRLALLHPLAVALLLAALWNSTARALLRGGIQWRGTF